VSLVEPGKTTRDIWLFDLARGLRTRFTFDPADELTAIWSPDGGRLLFSSRMKGLYDLYQKPSTGGGNEEVLLADTQNKFPSSWSPDGRSILYTAPSLSGSGFDIWILPLSGDKKPVPLLSTSFNEGFGQFSPDGQWIAYVSNESGRPEIYIAPFSGKGGKWQVSTSGGLFPRWRRDGRELFYIAPDSRLLAASVSAQSSGFEVGVVATLFATRAKANLRYPYDVTADGRRFLVNTLQDEASPEPFTLVLNWPAALRK
jgi:Tol biopolymer transport system component